MNRRILLVDDESNVLQACCRALHGRFRLDTALSGQEGLEHIAAAGDDPYAVVVSDMRMPGLDGVEFLVRVKAASPDSVRIMLTGNADQETAVTAVNRGAVFRFLNKPCPPELLTAALGDAIEHHRLVAAEKELLEKTLRGSVRLVTEVLSVLDPEGFGLALRMRPIVQAIARQLNMPRIWEVELAAMLSPVALFTLPDELRKRIRANLPLMESEQQLLSQGPGMSQRLLLPIPRLEGVAAILLYQHKHFDGSGYPDEPIAGEEIPQASRLLKVVGDMVQLESVGTSFELAIRTIREREGWYDPAMIDAYCLYVASSTPAPPVNLDVLSLKINHILARDVLTTAGCLLIRAGQVVTPTVLQRLRNHAFLGQIERAVTIIGPSQETQPAPPPPAVANVVQV